MLGQRKLDVGFNTLDIWLNHSRDVSAQPRVTKLEEGVPPKRRRRSKSDRAQEGAVVNIFSHDLCVRERNI